MIELQSTVLFPIIEFIGRCVAVYMMKKKVFFVGRQLQTEFNIVYSEFFQWIFSHLLSLAVGTFNELSAFDEFS